MNNRIIWNAFLSMQVSSHTLQKFWLTVCMLERGKIIKAAHESDEEPLCDSFYTWSGLSTMGPLLVPLVWTEAIFPTFLFSKKNQFGNWITNLLNGDSVLILQNYPRPKETIIQYTYWQALCIIWHLIQHEDEEKGIKGS